MTYYMHTIHGKPAYFSEFDGQIVHADQGGRFVRSRPALLVKSLRRLRREQAITRTNRRQWFPKDNEDDASKYGYVRVILPDE